MTEEQFWSAMQIFGWALLPCVVGLVLLNARRWIGAGEE